MKMDQCTHRIIGCMQVSSKEEPLGERNEDIVLARRFADAHYWALMDWTRIRLHQLASK